MTHKDEFSDVRAEDAKSRDDVGEIHVYVSISHALVKRSCWGIFQYIQQPVRRKEHRFSIAWSYCCV